MNQISRCFRIRHLYPVGVLLEQIPSIQADHDERTSNLFSCQNNCDVRCAATVGIYGQENSSKEEMNSMVIKRTLNIIKCRVIVNANDWNIETFQIKEPPCLSSLLR